MEAGFHAHSRHKRTPQPVGPVVSVDRGRVEAAVRPRYELQAELGHGAFGSVFAARDCDLDRDVAIKVLTASHDGAQANFKSEARVLAKLDHPHVVRVHDYLERDGLCLLFMELLPGGTLTRRQKQKPLPPEGACAVGLAVADALSSAHARGVLHRDTKPDNMLFGANGVLKVGDFGIFKIIEGTSAAASRIVGTPAYMAPEQITGGRLRPATDLYALGVVLYELLGGRRPFDPPYSSHHLNTAPTPPANLPQPVADVVMRALAKDPEERHPSARALALDLADAAVRAYGPRWTSRSEIVLHIDDEVREAAEPRVQSR